MTAITQTMWAALAALKKDGPRAAYPGLRLNTLDALVRRGLAKPYKRGVGAFFSPRISIMFKVSERGVAALNAHYGPDNDIHK
ncbi:MAG TPA: hypothetical protein VG892_07660 [Terriglobales bacterium]|nr:hypothetical protein [Terriglobales bacterium]